MPVRTIVTVLEARVDSYSRNLKAAGQATRDFSRDAERHILKHRRAYEAMGTAGIAVGTAALAGVAMAAKAAVDWESAWAGVTKTVDGTEAELAQLEEGLRSLARELPASHREIAAVAEAAGQLGVQREAIVGFTRVMVALGETTNLTADEAATSIAQLMNVMGTAPDDVDRLGASLVALGNDGASTERDIIQMAQRISGAGALIGLSEGEVMGVANALASVGIEVEAGGSAISRVMVDIAKSVSTGSADLGVFAEVAGMTAEDFAAAWKADPADALATFTEGLGRLHESGGDVFTVLDTLSLSDVRVQRALLTMASSGDMLRESLELGNAAWEDNTALAIEAAKRYDTTAAKMQVARNQLNDFAIDMGEIMLPALAGAADNVGALAEKLRGLPEPAKQGLVQLGALGGAASLLGGALLLALPRIVETRQAIRTLRAESPRAAGAMRGLGRAAGALAVISVAAVAMDSLASAAAGAPPKIEATTAALLDMVEGAAASEALSTVFETNMGAVDSFGEALVRLEDKTPGAKFWDPLLGSVGAGTVKFKQASQSIASIDDALASMVMSGNADMAGELHKKLAAEAGAAGISIEDMNERLPGYQEALAGMANEAELAAAATGGVGDEAAGVPPELEHMADAMGTAGEAAEELTDAQEALNDIIASFIDLGGIYQDALAANEEAMQASAEGQAEAHNDSIDSQIEKLRERTDAEITAVEASGEAGEKQKDAIRDRRDTEVDALEDQKTSWEDYAEGVGVSVDQYLEELEAQVQAQQDWQRNLLIISSRAGADVAEQLALMGSEAAPLVAEFVDASEEEFERFRAAAGRNAEDAVADMRVEIEQGGPVLAHVASVAGQKTADAYAKRLAEGTITVAEIAKEYGYSLEKNVPDVLGTTVEVYGAESAQAKMAAIDKSIQNVSGKSVKIGVNFAGDAYRLYQNKALAAGGRVRGPGGPEDDRAGMYRLSNDEYVVRNRAATQPRGFELLEGVNSGRLRPADLLDGVSEGYARGMATGGRVRVPNYPDARRTIWDEIDLALDARTSVAGDRETRSGISAMQRRVDDRTSTVTSAVERSLERMAAAGSGVFGRYSSGWPAKRYMRLSLNTADAARDVNRRFGTPIGTLGSRPNRSDHPMGKALDAMVSGWQSAGGIAKGNQVASFLQRGAAEYGLKYLIWRDKITSGSGWRAYTHPNGPTRNPTLRHMDHVHASFYGTGGYARRPTLGVIGERGPERVLDPRTTVAFERLVDVLSGSSGGSARAGATIHVTANYPVNEATSVTVNRAMQFAGAVGVI